jgi:hypothetical protein
MPPGPVRVTRRTVRPLQELSESGRFVFASNECGALHRKVVGARLRIAGRHIGEAVAHEARSRAKSRVEA